MVLSEWSLALSSYKKTIYLVKRSSSLAIAASFYKSVKSYGPYPYKDGYTILLTGLAIRSAYFGGGG